MNKVFKVIWNHATQSWVAVSELTKAKGKSSSKTDERTSPTKTLLALSVASGAMLGGVAMAATSSSGTLDGTASTGVAGAIALSDSAVTLAQAGGRDSIAIGTNATAPAWDAIAIGANATAKAARNVVIGANAVVVKNNAESQPANTVIGWSATDSGGNGNTILGSQATTHFANRNFSTSQQLALGSRAQVYGDQALAIGSDTLTGGNSSIAIGGDDINKAWDKMMAAIPELQFVGRSNVKGYAQARGYSSDMTALIATGRYPNTASVGDASVAIGPQSQAAGVAANALGTNALAFGDSSLAMGTLTRAYGNNTLAIGTVAIAGSIDRNNVAGDDAMAIGHYALASAANSTALGTRAHARGYESLTLGTNSNVTGNYSVALGPNILTVPTINSVVLGNGSTAVVGTTGASHAVKYVANATVRNSNGETITYGEWGFKGQPQTEGQYVSIGEVDNERQLKNVAAGHIDANSTDGINGSQLYAVMAKLETGFVVSNNTANLSNHITPNKVVNFNNGTGTIALAENWNATDGSIAGVNVTFDVKKSPLTLSDGSNTTVTGATNNTTPAGTVNVPADDDSFATASDVAKMINGSFWKVNSTTAGGENTYTPNTSSEISAGDELFINAGKNINITGAGNVLNISTVDTPTFTNLTVGNASNPITIGTDANGNNTISNLTSTLPKTQTEDVKTGDAVTTPHTTEQARPNITSDQESQAATLGDVLNAG
ncbi:hypothetical protein B0187_08520, partial [Haemophilus paracuniculus]